MRAKATTEQIVEAYRATGSVWKTAKQLGMCGQSVHERLKALGYKLVGQRWTPDDLTELGVLAGEELSISEIARRLGKPYAGVACKMSRLRLTYTGRCDKQKKLPRGAGFTKVKTATLAKQLAVYKGSLPQFVCANGLSVELLVLALQKYEPDFWTVFSRERAAGVTKTCPNCGSTYYPMSAKQKACTRRCADHRRRDLAYFGGKRNNAIGLAEGVCQLCLQKKKSGLSAHHVAGKENDPGHEYLIALCTGCHRLVGDLGGRKFVDEEQGWENLISLVMVRRLADREGEAVGVHVCVDMDFLSMEDLEGEGEDGSIGADTAECLDGEAVHQLTNAEVA